LIKRRKRVLNAAPFQNSAVYWADGAAHCYHDSLRTIINILVFDRDRQSLTKSLFLVIDHFLPAWFPHKLPSFIHLRLASLRPRFWASWARPISYS